METEAIDGWGMWSGGLVVGMSVDVGQFWECQSMLVSSSEVRKEEGTRRDDSFLR